MKFLYPVFILLCINACRKEKPEQNVPEYNPDDRWTHYVVNADSTALARYLYQPGTWWVYRDLEDNSRDSIWVTGNGPMTHYYEVPGGGTPGSGPSYTDYTYNYYRVNLAGQVHETNNINIVGGGLYIYVGVPYYYGYFGHEEVFYDSLQVQGNWYYNVTKRKALVNVPAGSSFPLSADNIFYINTDVGLIKKEMVDPVTGSVKTYELIHANIVR